MRVPRGLEAIPDPLKTNFLRMKEVSSTFSELELIFDRGMFLAEFAKFVLHRAKIRVDRLSTLPKEDNPLLSVHGSSGSGKTYSIGLLMAVCSRLCKGCTSSIQSTEYLKKEIGENLAVKLSKSLADMIVLPVTFNQLQFFLTSDVRCHQRHYTVFYFPKKVHVQFTTIYST